MEIVTNKELINNIIDDAIYCNSDSLALYIYDISNKSFKVEVYHRSEFSNLKNCLNDYDDHLRNRKNNTMISSALAFDNYFSFTEVLGALYNNSFYSGKSL